MIRFFLLGGLLVVLGACRGQQKSTQTESSQIQEDTTRADSVRYPDPGPAPGTVRMRVVVRSCKERSEEYHCRIKVRKELARGAAVPALSPGRTIGVRVARHWFDDQEEGEALSRPIEGSKLEVTLSHSEQPEFAGGSRPPWQVKAIH